MGYGRIKLGTRLYSAKKHRLSSGNTAHCSFTSPLGQFTPWQNAETLSLPYIYRHSRGRRPRQSLTPAIGATHHYFVICLHT